MSQELTPLLRTPMAWKTISSSACAPLGTSCHVVRVNAVFSEFTESHDLGMLWSPRRIRRDDDWLRSSGVMKCDVQKPVTWIWAISKKQNRHFPFPPQIWLKTAAWQCIRNYNAKTSHPRSPRILFFIFLVMSSASVSTEWELHQGLQPSTSGTPARSSFDVSHVVRVKFLRLLSYGSRSSQKAPCSALPVNKGVKQIGVSRSGISTDIEVGRWCIKEHLL